MEVINKITKFVSENIGDAIAVVGITIIFNNYIFRYVNNFFLAILNNDNIGELLQGVGIAILTILIPLAIAVLSGFLDYKSKKDNTGNPLFTIELYIVLDYVLNIKRLILGSAFIFLPTLFWEESNLSFRIIELSFWAIGISILVWQILSRIYKWIKTSDFQFHRIYLEKLKNKDEVIIVWNSVWQGENLNIRDEVSFLTIFSIKIEEFFNGIDTGLLIIEKLLKGFQLSIKNRNMVSFFYPDDFFRKILGWRFQTWDKRGKYLDYKKSGELWMIYRLISDAINSIFKNISKGVISHQEGHVSHPFFVVISNHYKLFKNNVKYLENLFEVFCPIFLDNISDSPDKYDIWNHYFPNDWKITKNNVEKIKNGYASRVWLIKFLDWALPKIRDPKEGVDLNLDDVVRNLFPDIDPILWSKFLIFAFSPSSRETRIRSVINTYWNFGFVGHMFSGINIDNYEKEFRKQQESFEKNTIDFIYFFNSKIKNVFSRDDLSRYKIELEKLKGVYKESSKKETKRVELLHFINRLIRYSNNK